MDARSSKVRMRRTWEIRSSEVKSSGVGAQKLEGAQELENESSEVRGREIEQVEVGCLELGKSKGVIDMRSLRYKDHKRDSFQLLSHSVF